MPKIPELGRGPVTAGGTVTPLKSGAPTAQINLNALGAVNRANAEMADAFSDLGKQLFDKSKKLQVQEEVNQGREDYEKAVRDGTDELQREYNKGELDFKNYEEDYELMLMDIGIDFEDRFTFDESKSNFADFKSSHDRRTKAQANIHQTKGITNTFITKRLNSWQEKERQIEARPVPYEASATLVRELESLGTINEVGKMAPEELERYSRAYHKGTLDSLMRGYMTNGTPGEGLNFLSRKNDPHYKNITKKVDAGVIAGWEERLKNKMKVDGQIRKGDMNRNVSNFMTAAADGEISSGGQIEIDKMIADVDASNFSPQEKSRFKDRLSGIKTANDKFNRLKEMSLPEKTRIFHEIKSGRFKFFDKAPSEFNAAQRKRDEAFYLNALVKDTKQMMENTGEYIARNDESVGMLAQLAYDLENKSAVSAYIKKVKEKKAQLGVPNGKVLTQPMQDKLIATFETNQPMEAAMALEGYRLAFDDQAGVVFKDLNGKVSNNKLIALSMEDKNSRFLVLKNQANAKKIYKEASEKGFKKSVIKSNGEIGKIIALKNASDPFGSSNPLWDPIIENVTLETARLVNEQEMDLSDAAELAKKNIFDSNFDSHDSGILIPKEYDVSEEDMDTFIDDFEDFHEEIVDKKVNEGFNMENVKWFNSPDGVVLRTTNNRGRAGATIIGKNGKQVRVTFEDIRNKSYIEKMKEPFEKQKAQNVKDIKEAVINRPSFIP